MEERRGCEAVPAQAYNWPVGYSVYPFREYDEDSRTTRHGYPGLSPHDGLVIDCTDNATARQAMAECLPGDPGPPAERRKPSSTHQTDEEIETMHDQKETTLMTWQDIHSGNSNGNGYPPAPVNGNANGHYDQAEEPPQPLFSWAESMAEEPVKPKRGNGKLSPQACPCSSGRLAWRRGLRRRRLARDVKVETQEGEGIAGALPLLLMYAAFLRFQAIGSGHVCGLFCCLKSGSALTPGNSPSVGGGRGERHLAGQAGFAVIHRPQLHLVVRPLLQEPELDAGG